MERELALGAMDFHGLAFNAPGRERLGDQLLPLGHVLVQSLAVREHSARPAIDRTGSGLGPGVIDLSRLGWGMAFGRLPSVDLSHSVVSVCKYYRHELALFMVKNSVVG